MALCFEYLIVTFGFLSPLPQQQQVIEDARPSWIDELFQHHIAIIHKRWNHNLLLSYLPVRQAALRHERLGKSPFHT